MSRTADLIALLRWERKKAPELPWATAEEYLGVTFPSDCKDLVSAYGTGSPTTRSA
ncbi:hypothetical protein SK803_22210 [Lentzea sp. BCCO 10_0856]|uniref:Uncharacterized protein n=1 Tax=Lentzea miocenica TaxID=3095431 RepID=A0ABU4T439_9PSEU|nr:hypothetical protein [Lentzea sp. BCCO 10_0856]MDX8032941.1 hypothetical protein [Lentzea sp. BCCO 10_0856]